MRTIYNVNADELDLQFLEELKGSFKNKHIEIVVSDSHETGNSPRSPANRERFLKALEDINQNRRVVIPDQQPFR